VILAGAALALRFVCHPDGAPPLARYGVWAAASTAAAFAASIAPANWGKAACEAIAINSAAAVVVATLGLAATATVLTGASWRRRAAGVLASGAVAAAVCIAIEPQCLAGPFVVMDPTVRAIWFNHVSEMQSLRTVAETSPAMAAAVAAFPAIAMMCMLALARDSAMRRDFGFVVAAVALVIACGVMVAMVRAYSYAIWLAIPLVAAWALRLFASLRVGTLVARTLTMLMLTPTVTSAVALAAMQAMTHRPVEGDAARVAEGCLLTENYKDLARLPPGLVASDIDYGPFVLALTPHSVMSAPYHRLAAPLIAANQIFALPPAAARGVVAQFKPTYLVTCGRHTLGGIGPAERAASLWGRLAAGEIPDWLEQVPQTRDQPLVVYRVKL
jgi:hypothetical protein